MPEIIIHMRIELVNATEAGAPIDRERLRDLCESISQFSSVPEAFGTALDSAGISYDELSLVVPEDQGAADNTDSVKPLSDEPTAVTYTLSDETIGYCRRGLNEIRVRRRLSEMGYGYDESWEMADIITKLAEDSTLRLEPEVVKPVDYVKDANRVTVEPEGTVTQGDTRFAQFPTFPEACAYLEDLGWQRSAS